MKRRRRSIPFLRPRSTVKRYAFDATRLVPGLRVDLGAHDPRLMPEVVVLFESVVGICKTIEDTASAVFAALLAGNSVDYLATFAPAHATLTEGYAAVGRLLELIAEVARLDGTEAMTPLLQFNNAAIWRAHVELLGMQRAIGCFILVTGAESFTEAGRQALIDSILGTVENMAAVTNLESQQRNAA